MSRQFTVVTSFSNDGYRLYGKRFLDTFRRYWPSSVDLVVYHEGIDEESLLGFKGVNLLDLQNFKRFESVYGNDQESCGRSQRRGFYWKPKAIEAGYNFRFDAMKFCRKVFALQHAATIIDRGCMIWLDADVVTFDSVSTELLESTNPESFAISHLERANYHSECGYVGYNLEDAACRIFMVEFADTYLSGEVFNIPEWHDSFVFDWLLRKLSINSYKIPSRGGGHVFVTSELGSCMDHLKGDRKVLGKSRKTGVGEIHAHPYWRGQ